MTPISSVYTLPATCQVHVQSFHMLSLLLNTLPYASLLQGEYTPMWQMKKLKAEKATHSLKANLL